MATTPLRRWLDANDLSIEDLARRCSTSLNTMSEISRGKRRPTDSMKFRIEAATRARESELGVAEPTGVRPVDWFDTDETQDERPAAARRR